MMRGAILVVVMLAGCSQPAARRGGIVSTNPCADAILVRLVEPGRIAAISHYSHDPGATSLPLAVARRFATTAGTAEEVIARAPDLVLADSFAPASTLAAYRQAGLRVEVLDSPATVAASIAQVRQVAAAVGETGRGEMLATEIERSLRPAVLPGPRALFFISGDLASGSGNLLDEMLRVAGLRNAAAAYGLSFTGTIPVETLIANPPDVVIATGMGRSEALRRRLLPGVRQVPFARSLLNCGGPSISPALARLRAIRAES